MNTKNLKSGVGVGAINGGAFITFLNLESGTVDYIAVNKFATVWSYVRENPKMILIKGIANFQKYEKWAEFVDDKFKVHSGFEGQTYSTRDKFESSHEYELSPEQIEWLDSFAKMDTDYVFWFENEMKRTRSLRVNSTIKTI